MNRGGVGARSVNIELQAALNPVGERKVERFGWTFAPGDKVMQIENDYDKEVYNGDIGYIDDVDPETGELVASFDGRSVTYGFGELDTLVPAYAATIHKSQGSEYPAVIIPVLTQHYPMLQRNLLYTGVTRGKRLVVLRRPEEGHCHRGSPEIQVEQGLLFVALVLVLLAQAQDFPEDFHIEALSLGLCEDFLLALVQRLDLFVDAFNALDKGANAIAWDSCRVCHACSLFKRHTRMQRK